MSTSLRRNYGYKSEWAEKRLWENFKKYGVLMEPRLCNSVWENMIIAQHHGIPTRLLDFSTSPLVALHFALTDNIDNEDAVVWAVNIHTIHTKLLPSKYKEILNKYDAYGFTVDMMNELRISINGPVSRLSTN